MSFKTDSVGTIGPSTLALRCPSCGRDGTFDTVGQQHDFRLSPANVAVGHRRCPNPECHAYIWVAYHANAIFDSYPHELLDFDQTNVPTRVSEALGEAIQCHAARCYTAAAIMVRKTLEELCADREVQGDNLKERIRALGNKVVIPAELLDGLDDLRLLGNDAAHVESTVYDQIGQEEVEVGVEFAKEVLKAVYQYSALLARLRALKAQHED